MAIYTIAGKDIQSGVEMNLSGVISLPSSKSISNRLLIIRAITGSDVILENLSTAEDTRLLQELLKQIEIARLSHHANPPFFLDCHNAGTVMRFLTAYLSLQPGTWLLSGSERMKKRPIGILVEALRSLGASIEYTGTPGYPPLQIVGKELTGGEVTVDASVSSQYVSALLLIAPRMPQGLTIKIVGNQVSFPYVEMTKHVMEEFGIVTERREDFLIVKPGSYKPEARPTNRYTVEADWSSAAFWYEAAALSGYAEIRLPGLHKNSIQGDVVLVELFRLLGVETTFEDKGILLTKAQCTVHRAQGTGHRAQGTGHRAQGTGHSWQVDLASFPDLAPPLIVTCAVLGIPVRFTGLHHLKIKESDRLQSLITELKRINVIIRHPASGLIEIDEQTPLGERTTVTPPVIIQTYGDHRIAMAFALLAIRTGTICISDPDVVSKSYPGFWEEMERLGFEVSET